ncbi:MAG TPA: hypothetical protein VE133_16105, partial [Candidatus Sulfotelmatobacter sp.]|nr:hypothetical protein [Candidatus Sulfotelmatobacter sp.]
MEQTHAALTTEAAKSTANAAPPQSEHQQNTELDSGALFMHRLHATAGNRHAGRWLQAKLRVGSPNDEYEHEADRVADQVMRMPDPASIANAAPPAIQRKCGQCAAEEEKTGTIQRKCAQCAMAEEQSRQEETGHSGPAVVQRKCAECAVDELRMKSAEQPVSSESARETTTDEIHQSGVSGGGA